MLPLRRSHVKPDLLSSLPQKVYSCHTVGQLHRHTSTLNCGSIIGVVKPSCAKNTSMDQTALNCSTLFIPSLSSRREAATETHVDCVDLAQFFTWARHGRYNKVHDFLQQGIPIDTQDPKGNTLLIIACQTNNQRLVKLALRNGGSINQQNSTGNTGIKYAVQYGYTALAEYLLSKGADDSLVDHRGLTMYEAAHVSASERIF